MILLVLVELLTVGGQQLVGKRFATVPLGIKQFLIRQLRNVRMRLWLPSTPRKNPQWMECYVETTNTSSFLRFTFSRLLSASVSLHCCFFIRFCVLHGRGMTDNTFLLKPHTIPLNLSPGSQRSWSLLGQGRVSGRSDCQISDPGWYSK